MRKFLIVLLGLILYPFLKMFPIKRETWIIGAQDGLAYVDNAKYLFEYIKHNQPSINVIWITRSKDVINRLRKNKMPVVHNLSITALWYIIRAEIVAFSTTRSDILFIHPKKNRKIVNLWHGMPIKKIAYDYEPHKPENKSLKDKIWDLLVAGFQHKDVDLIASTSPYYNRILESSFRNDKVAATGQPRTDAFYNWDASVIKEKLGFSENDFIVTYMPTHRAYGAGLMNPKIFQSRKSILHSFSKKKIKVVWKFHKNMLHNYDDSALTPPELIDLTRKNVDPQKLLFISDILITDYSSCYIDYLLLDRPIIFYHYDDYERNDNELYFSIKDNNPGPIIESEDELGKAIQKLYSGEDNYKVRRKKFLDLYHANQDGMSSKRVFELIKSKT